MKLDLHGRCRTCFLWVRAMIYFLIGAVVLLTDLLTKLWAKLCLAEIVTIPVIEKIFHLTYVENRGAAFGVFQGQRVFFVLVAIVVAVLVGYIAIKYKNKPWMLNLGLSFLSAGALGNTIDRIWRGYVVDFFDFRLIDFPVFNIADIFVCLGAGLLAVFFVFFEEKYKKRECEHDEN